MLRSSAMLLLLITTLTLSQSNVITVVDDAPHQETIQEGARDVIRCDVSGLSQSPKWRKIVSEQEVLEIGGFENKAIGHYKVLKNGNLEISAVRKSDSGIYICYTKSKGKIHIHNDVFVRVQEVFTTTAEQAKPDIALKSETTGTNGAIVFLAVVGVVMFVILADFCCFYIQGCGLINCLYVHYIEPKRKREAKQQQGTYKAF